MILKAQLKVEFSNHPFKYLHSTMQGSVFRVKFEHDMILQPMGNLHIRSMMMTEIQTGEISVDESSMREI